ncbi:unnamed protein product [Caenorhabditis angaria]|uniref:Uncharacterized protein n=1 Tax=Caenorhabditis angaria TaxID=860376 RepID=A0A9P1N3B7_9PELO|nr:unnamed protein product [Caenorhabditis angaria]
MRLIWLLFYFCVGWVLSYQAPGVYPENELKNDVETVAKNPYQSNGWSGYDFYYEKNPAAALKKPTPPISTSSDKESPTDPKEIEVAASSTTGKPTSTISTTIPSPKHARSLPIFDVVPDYPDGIDQLSAESDLDLDRVLADTMHQVIGKVKEERLNTSSNIAHAKKTLTVPGASKLTPITPSLPQAPSDDEYAKMVLPDDADLSLHVISSTTSTTRSVTSTQPVTSRGPPASTPPPPAPVPYSAPREASATSTKASPEATTTTSYPDISVSSVILPSIAPYSISIVAHSSKIYQPKSEPELVSAPIPESTSTSASLSEYPGSSQNRVAPSHPGTNSHYLPPSPAPTQTSTSHSGYEIHQTTSAPSQNRVAPSHPATNAHYAPTQFKPTLLEEMFATMAPSPYFVAPNKITHSADQQQTNSHAESDYDNFDSGYESTTHESIMRELSIRDIDRIGDEFERNLESVDFGESLASNNLKSLARKSIKKCCSCCESEKQPVSRQVQDLPAEEVLIAENVVLQPASVAGEAYVNPPAPRATLAPQPQPQTIYQNPIVQYQYPQQYPQSCGCSAPPPPVNCCPAPQPCCLPTIPCCPQVPCCPQPKICCQPPPLIIPSCPIPYCGRACPTCPCRSRRVKRCAGRSKRQIAPFLQSSCGNCGASQLRSPRVKRMGCLPCLGRKKRDTDENSHLRVKRMGCLPCLGRKKRSAPNCSQCSNLAQIFQRHKRSIGTGCTQCTAASRTKREVPCDCQQLRGKRSITKRKRNIGETCDKSCCDYSKCLNRAKKSNP